MHCLLAPRQTCDKNGKFVDAAKNVFNGNWPTCHPYCKQACALDVYVIWEDMCPKQRPLKHESVKSTQINIQFLPLKELNAPASSQLAAQNANPGVTNVRYGDKQKYKCLDNR